MTARTSVWLPLALAGLAAAFVGTVLPAERAPTALVALLRPAARSPLDIHGGARLTLAVDGDEAAAAAVAEALAERLRAFGAAQDAAHPTAPPTVQREGPLLIVELPGVAAEDAPAVARQLVQQGRLGFGAVEESGPALERLAAAAEADPAARAAGIEVVRRRHDPAGRGPWLEAPEHAALSEWVRALPPDRRPEPPLTVGFEDVTDAAESAADGAAPPRRWRTHVLRPVPGLSHEQVREAGIRVDDRTGEPFVTAAFDDAGTARFAEVTEQLVDRKLAILVDDVVTSAPVVKERIEGGRVLIALGGGRSPAELWLAGRALVGALSTGPLPAALSVREQSVAAPVVSSGSLKTAAWLFAALVGLAVFAVALGVRRLAPAPAPAAPGHGAAPAAAPLAPRGPVALRLAVTVACAAAVPLLERLPLVVPGIDAGAAAEAEATGSLSVFSLGLVPVMVAAFLVELVALVVPGLRRRRHAGPQARAPLVVAAGVLGLVLAALQGYGIVVWLQSLGLDGNVLLDEEYAWAGTVPGPAIVATLCAGAAAWVLLAGVAGRFGLAAGFSTVLLGGAVSAAIDLWWGAARRGSGPDEIASLVAVLAVAVGGVVVALRARVRSPDGVLTLRLPASGLVPVDLLGVLVLLAALFPPDSWLGAVSGAEQTLPLAARLALAAGAAVLFAWLFCWPRRLGPLAARAAGAAAPVDEAAALRAARAVARRTLLPTAVCVAGLAALGHAANRLGGLTTWDLLSAAAAAAITLDILDEWRARRRLGPLAPVWPLQRVHAADLVVRDLAAAGIPAHVRGASHRTLLQFYGPYVPATVLVPPEHARAAHDRVAALFAPETGAPAPDETSGGDAGPPAAEAVEGPPAP